MRYLIKSIAISFVLLFWLGCQEKHSVNHVDVLIIGGGASGTMAGIQAARLGANTLIVEETVWLGGMLTSAGVSAIDGNYKLYSGLWQEFREKIYQYYGGEDSVKTGWVSNVLFEPNVGADILLEMAECEQNLNLWFQSQYQKIERLEDVWKVSIDYNGEVVEVLADIIIDGTELGDVSKSVGVDYVIGMDSRSETGEDIAPEQGNDIVQDLTYVAILKDYQSPQELVEKPEDYDASKFWCTCAGKCLQDSLGRKLWDCEQMMKYGQLPNGKFMINWPIFGNDYYLNAIELTPEQREFAFEKAKDFTKGYVYYLQTELGFINFGIADDVFPTQDGFPMFPYHRESRRIEGMVRFDINDLARPFDQEDFLYRTGIAVGDYPVDHHHAAYPEHQSLPDLHFYPVPSYGLPLGSLIPKNVDHFVTAEKSISVTNLVNGTTRLQPVCLLIGQAAGTLAFLASRDGITPREVSVREVQEELLNSGAYIMPYSDVVPDEESFLSIQRVGATGILKGEGLNIGWENHTLFYPDSLLKSADLRAGMNEFSPSLRFQLEGEFITVNQSLELFRAWLESDEIGEQSIREIWDNHDLGDLVFTDPISRRQFSVLLDKIADPFRAKDVDHHGRFIDSSE